MSKINFNFISNKFFLSGLITGVVITAAVFLVIISSNYPPPAKDKVSGTMSVQGWVPAVGESGIVVSSGSACGYTYVDVTFDNDPNNTVIRCHSDIQCAPSQQVVVYSYNSGEFCQGGGATIQIIPEQL
ncbi:MAG: hypothetical protein AB9842_05560 [Bacteroidales bacterium]